MSNEEYQREIHKLGNLFNKKGLKDIEEYEKLERQYEKETKPLEDEFVKETKKLREKVISEYYDVMISELEIEDVATGKELVDLFSVMYTSEEEKY